MATVRIEADDFSAAAYGGVDVLLYRVPEPLDFLKQQKDLHKLNLSGNFRGEGAANALRYLWDQWYQRSRKAWQRVFSASARGGVTHIAPELKTTLATQTRHAPVRQYQPLKGFDLLDEFRYPLQSAKPESPSKAGRLAGSSSEFTNPGNVRVPLGKLKPGLYIVEAYLGSYRAATLLFVADTALFTKISAAQMLAWTANKQSGVAVADSKLAWSDGNGVLKSGETDQSGLLVLNKAAPEQSYIYGVDTQGGALVSESFYYPSEVNSSKIYLVTDRPLYRPGDVVNVAVVGRTFNDAREHRALQPETVQLLLRDPAGTALSRHAIELGVEGGHARFTLPDNAVAGGYELRMIYHNSPYAAPFRVAEYTKPHYDIAIELDRPILKTGEAVEGRVSMRYPDGRPVANANVELVLRRQRVSMVGDEIKYQGLFPLKLRQDTLKLDANGRARFSLPAADEPSRYVLRVIGSQSGAYPVTASREVLIDSATSHYHLDADKQFSAPGETAYFTLINDWPGANKPVSWDALRLEDQSVQRGGLEASARKFPIRFSQSGSYQITVRDSAGKSLGQGSQLVMGQGVRVESGAISLLFDHEIYQVGDVAEGLLTFPEEVSDALLTLELENVQEKATLARGANWLRLEKLSPRQWKIRLPIQRNYRPNMSFSVLYAKHGNYSFQNRGLAVAQPKVDVAIHADHKTYRPGDLVTLDIATSIGGKAAAAQLMLGVVDETVYLLQPEITPDIHDFFYHAHRNAVRTSSSLSFYGYDMAWSPRANDHDEMRYSSRSQKMLVRPRRENIDTAYWNGAVKTGVDGKVKIQFRMPDALDRWRITARAMTADGVVGQGTSYINSDQPAYLQWAAAQDFREGDIPRLQIAVTQQAERAHYQLVIRAGGIQKIQELDLGKGTSYIPIETGPLRYKQVVLELKKNNKLIDRLIADVRLLPVQDMQTVSQTVVLKHGKAEVSLPADAQHIRLQWIDSGDAAFRRVADDLIAYPYGCVEQTASRLLPLSLAYEKLHDMPPVMREELHQRIETARLRLLKMSGPGAVFSWWGDMSQGDPMLSAYARLAEFHASSALGLSRRLDNSASFQALYAAQVKSMSPLHRALTLWMAADVGEPTRTQLSGLVDSMAKWPAIQLDANAAVNIMNNPDSPLGRMATLVLVNRLAKQQKLALPDALQKTVQAAASILRQRPEPWLQVLVAWSQDGDVDVAPLLSQLGEDTPTLERSLALFWLSDRWRSEKINASVPSGRWREQASVSGNLEWQLLDTPVSGFSIQSASAAEPLSAMLRYDTARNVASVLPVKIHRQLYLLQSHGGAEATFSAKPVEWQSKLAIGQLYVDEIILDSSKNYRYGLLEAALPPGAQIESQHWGLNIDNLPGQDSYLDENFDERATLAVQAMQLRPLGYAQPVERLEGKVVLRQIVRFTQAGHFSLPPARYFRMYVPGEFAYEDGGIRDVEIR